MKKVPSPVVRNEFRSLLRFGMDESKFRSHLPSLSLDEFRYLLAMRVLFFIPIGLCKYNPCFLWAGRIQTLLSIGLDKSYPFFLLAEKILKSSSYWLGPIPVPSSYSPGQIPILSSHWPGHMQILSSYWPGQIPIILPFGLDQFIFLISG